MSASDKEIYNVGSSGGGIHAREEDGGGDGGGGKKQREDGYGSGRGGGRGRCGCTGDFAKARQVILCVLTKAEKRLLRRRNRKTSFSGGSPAAAAANRRTSGKRFDSVGRRAKGCCSCFTQPQTLESPSHTSDPNDPNFTYEMLKAFVEKNDFYSKECNTHLNFDVASHAS